MITRKAQHLSTRQELLEFAQEWFADGHAYKTVSAYYDKETDVYICDLDGNDRKKKFLLVYMNLEGSYPMKLEEYDTYEEAQALADEYNQELDTQYERYYVLEI